MVMTLWYYRNTPPPGVSAVAVAAAGCTQVPNFTNPQFVYTCADAYDVMQDYVTQQWEGLHVAGKLRTGR